MQTIDTFDNITAFTERIITQLQKTFPKYNVYVSNVTKNNDTSITGVTVAPHPTGLAPIIYMEPYFEKMQQNYPFERIMKDIITSVQETIDCNVLKEINYKNMQDFNKVKNRICYKLVNTALNRNTLEKLPHRDYLDLSIIYYILLNANATETISARVTNELMQHWNINEETLFELASKNTPKINRGVVMTMDTVLKQTSAKYEKHKNFDFDKSKPTFPMVPLYVATTWDKSYGAAVLLYKDVLKTIGAKIGSLCIIPSSVHEFIFTPYGKNSAEDVNNIIRTVNQNELKPNEILSYNCYHYNAETDELTIA